MKAKFKNIVPIKKMSGKDQKDTQLLRKMHSDASEFLMDRSYCSKIVNSHFGLGVGGVVAVFLFEWLTTHNSRRWTWIVVGDLPSAMISADDNSTPKEALIAYVSEMKLRTKATVKDMPVDYLIPVKVPPDPEIAKLMRKLLKKRLKLLETRFLS